MKSRTLFLAALALASVSVTAADKDKKFSKAQDVVNRARPADPPKASGGTTNAADIARRENERERQRQAAESRKRKLDKGNVPAPGTR